MNSSEIRKSFIDYFVSKQHTYVPSAPVVPADDPTIMFTNAGMNQFKDLFLGTGDRTYTRAANSQKCIRVSGKHNDLEEVGFDTYHHTFFEMLGNWSFGDYYKKEAIVWAWELLTDVWKLPQDKLYATVFRDDDEAEELWKQHTFICPDQVLRFGEKENFWEMGDTGPCGPCSEIHMDLGEEACDKQHVPGHECRVNGDCGRFIEIWNLVFIQFNRKPDGSLEELKSKHVDTGMGFERITAIMQQKTSNYDTDIFQPIIKATEALCTASYKENPVPFRVIADHIRTLSFAIADGVVPSNEGRGYVIRRILRRASRYGRNIGFLKPFLGQLSKVVVETMGDIFPELKEKEKYIQEVLKSEESNFLQTLEQGIQRFEQLVSQDTIQASKVIPGEEAFRLYDTYGFPFDLTSLMARERGFIVDEAAFQKSLEEQRERARAHAKRDDLLLKYVQQNSSSFAKTKFVGYDTEEIRARLLLVLEQKVDALSEQKMVSGGQNDSEKRWAVFEQSPCYGEGGGQVGDHGVIFDLTHQPVANILDTQKREERFFHLIQLIGNGSLQSGQEYFIQIDRHRRRGVMANHTATHALQKALRLTLGDHVGQAGSLVHPDRLRFDFTHHKPLSVEELSKIEELVNGMIQSYLPVSIQHTNMEKAKEMGAMAFFGEKYGEEVRVIQFGDSIELCGGTHVRNTADILIFKILKESSPGAGIRRIEAAAGYQAANLLLEQSRILEKVVKSMGVSAVQLPETIQILQEKAKQQRKTDSSATTEALNIKEILEQYTKINHFEVLSFIFPENTDMEILRQTADRFRDKDVNRVALLATHNSDKAILLFACSKELVTQNMDCNQLMKVASPFIQGGGGGRPDFVQAGGKRKEGLSESLHAAQDFISKMKG